jgi:4-diphosphocytidyl-2-C-methyl-D-erythritol kinase
MTSYARRLGADCAFFIENKPVFAFEKGDEFETIKLDLSAYKIVLVMPDIHISTSEAFGGIKPTPVKDSLIELITEPITNGRSILKMILKLPSLKIIWKSVGLRQPFTRPAQFMPA